MNKCKENIKCWVRKKQDILISISWKFSNMRRLMNKQRKQNKNKDKKNIHNL
jgi:hypothetical protein